MIRRLRIRFTLLAMTSMLIVLTVLIGGINIINYRKVITDADGILEDLSENKGAFALRDNPGPVVPPPDMNGNDRPVPGGEEMFSSRYFSVLLDPEGEVIETDMISIYMVDEDSAIEYAYEVMDGGKAKGFCDQYRYLVSSENDNTRVIFYDCSKGLDSFRTFRNTSILVSGLGLLLVYILIRLLSGIITRPAVESYEKQKRFITDAGHELKTPLAIICADTDVLETAVGEDNEWTSDIKKQVGNLTGLTNDLVYLSKMEEAANRPVREDVNLSEIVRKVSDQFTSRAATDSKQYTVDIEDGISIKSNANSICHICSILLDNAMKYSPSEGDVKITLKKNDKYAVISVTNDMRDKITEEDLKHIFDRFYRADSSRNSETGGHGLGLSIAKAETENLSGRITVSKEDDRITFKVKLPLR